MATSTIIGFPRVGALRELKFAQEKYWSCKIQSTELLSIAQQLRLKHYKQQFDAGLTTIPCGDFSLYDQVLDMSLQLGVIPSRYEQLRPTTAIETEDDILQLYFAMARGAQAQGAVESTTCGCDHTKVAENVIKITGETNIVACAMKKWFDTNYHYIVPEIEDNFAPKLFSKRIIEHFIEATTIGGGNVNTIRPVIIGPVTYVLLSHIKTTKYTLKEIIQLLLPVYIELINELIKNGAKSIQFDEPCVSSFDLTSEQAELYDIVYKQSIGPLLQSKSIELFFATYFESLRDQVSIVASLPINVLHIDLCRTAGKANALHNDSNIDIVNIANSIKDTNIKLSCGIVDARNVFKNNLSESISIIQKAVNIIGTERIIVAGSSSLLHTPFDLSLETKLDNEIKSWLAFAVQKLTEIVIITKGINNIDSIQNEIKESDHIVQLRKTSPRINNPDVQKRLQLITPELYQRKSPFSIRSQLQQDKLQLPLFPTTTIGSFPQTANIRSLRAKFRTNKITEDEYIQQIQTEIQKVVSFQEEVGLDVLVHGEPERVDMVEYFAELLNGYILTEYGWVTSYGARCVKPGIIIGDISRPQPMTVKWSQYAQSLTNKPMKGMLTGPVTMLQWSFVRDDQPRHITAQQLALSLRDEVCDLEAGGIRIIQVDEAAIREGLCLRRADQDFYLQWAVDSFRLTTAGVQDSTQCHSHMCYSAFNEIIEYIARMDADVISIETSRNQFQLLEALKNFTYPNHIGPGVMDIHSPVVLTQQFATNVLTQVLTVLKPTQVWVNPDCGLKTRQWPEVDSSLRNLVQVAKKFREQYQQQ